MITSHPANIPGGPGAFFASPRSRCKINQGEFACAEKLFGDALVGIDPALWKSTLFLVFNKFVETYEFPTGLSARARLPGWADTTHNTPVDGTESVYLQTKGAKYQVPVEIRDASPWKQIAGRGNLKNQKAPGVDVVKGSSRATKIAGVLRTGGKFAGCACTVLDGVVSAYDSYQSDFRHHPEMGQGEKITRTGVTGAASATGAYFGATYGAQLGTVIGTVSSPIGILVGGVIGGITGGLSGNKLEQTVGSIINNSMRSLTNTGGPQLWLSGRSLAQFSDS